MNETRDLLALLKSRICIITINSHEEPRAIDLIKTCSNALKKNLKLWSITKGLVDASTGNPHLSLVEKGLKESSEHQPLTLLKDIEAQTED